MFNIQKHTDYTSKYNELVDELANRKYQSSYNDKILEVANQLANRSYQSSYNDKILDMANQLANREKFSYNFNADPIYQQYAKQYQDAGKRAMQDTQAQAAALSGGYGNSYGASAGAQAYNEYLQNLKDIIPTLQSNAQSVYDAETTRLNNNLAALQTAESTAKGAYDDETTRLNNLLSTYQTAESTAKDAYDEETTRLKNLLSMYSAAQSFNNSSSGSSSSSSGSGGSGSGSSSGTDDTTVTTQPLYKAMGYKTQSALDTEIQKLLDNGYNITEFGDWLSGESTGLGDEYEDMIYELYNKWHNKFAYRGLTDDEQLDLDAADREAQNWVKFNSGTSNVVQTPVTSSEAMKLGPEVIAKYNYIYKTQGKNAALKYLEQAKKSV